MTHKPIFAFDFSMNKPAMAALIGNKLSFYVWPSDIDKVSEQKLSDCGINVFNRCIPPITKSKFDENSLVLEHVTRAKNLAIMICDTIRKLAEENNINIEDAVVSNEGYSYGSKGDAILELASYKGIFLYMLMEMGVRHFQTYSPTTLKSTAGCATKEKRKLGKTAMIDAVGEQNKTLHTFIYMIAEHPELLKKKTAYCLCVDDLADAFWCLKTTIKKLDINCILSD